MSNSNQKLPVLYKNKTRYKKKTLVNERSSIVNIHRNFQSVNLNDMFGIIGDSHRYQFVMLISLSIIASVQAFFIFSLFFQFKIPDFQCKNLTTNEIENCSRLNYCTQKNTLELITSVPSILENFSMFCITELMLTKILTLIIFSSILILSPFYLLNKIKGRKQGLMILTTLQIICCIIIINASNFYTFTIILTLNFTCAAVWLISAFLYIIESSGKKFHNKSFKIYSIFIALSIIACSFVFQKQINYKSIYKILMMVLVLLSCFYLVLVESPAYLKSNSNIFEFYLALREIARINYSPLRAEKRKDRIKKILFDDIDPSVDLNNISSFYDKNDLYMVDHSNNSKNLKLKMHPLNFKQMQIKKKIRQMNKIFKINLRDESAFRIPGFVLLNMIYHNVLIFCSSFITFIFWFSIDILNKQNNNNTSIFISFSFFIGMLCNLYSPFRIPFSFSLVGSLLIISLMLSFTHLKIFFDQESEQEKLRNINIPFMSLLLSGFYFFIGLGFFSSLKNSLKNFKKDILLLSTICMLFSIVLGISCSGFLTSYFRLNDVPILWGIFVVTAFALPLSMLSPIKNEKIKQTY